jgi:hypothetical protein
MNDADTFHAVVADYGGRLDTTNLHPPLAEGLNYAAQRARGFLQSAAALPEMPPIYFDFIDNWEFNAKAFRQDGRYFIGIYRGAIATLGVLFDRMLADPQVLPFIGDAKEEAADLPLLPDIGLDFRRSVASAPTFPRPRHWARELTARKLVELALDFLTAHEFAHIANGHLDYIADHHGIGAIDEVSRAAWTSETTESALISQTMEMDADATAVLISLGSEWSKVAGSFPRPGQPWTEFYDYPGRVSLLWSWAVSSLFRLLGEARLTVGDVTQESYPRPRLRSVMIQQAAGRVLRPQGLHTKSPLIGDELHHIPMTIKAGQVDAEKMFTQLTGKPEATEGFDEAWGDVGKSQMYRLQDYWQTKLKGELLRFAQQPLSSYGDFGEEVTGKGS